MDLRKCLRTAFVAMAALTSPLIYAQDDGSVLSEGFESGRLPEGWTQEHVIGSHDWTVEGGDGLSRPDGTHSGNYRIALRNNTNQKEGFRTMLILPPVDVTGMTKPVISFAYAQDSWAGDFDTLRIYYRTTEDMPWATLKVYDKYTSVWTTDMVELVSSSKTYQLAFEGSDNLGRGIVLDDISIRPCPECSQPTVTVSDMTQESATLYWSGSSDTRQFHVRVSEEPLSDFLLGSNRDEYRSTPVDTLLDGTARSLKVDGLSLGGVYYVYIRALCGSENSLWSTEVEFNTLQKVSVPYFEDFNLEVTGMAQQHKDWFFGTSYNQNIPYINTNVPQNSFGSYSPDATPCLAFGSETYYNAIPGGYYAYAATPEIDIEDISQLQITFYGSRLWGSYNVPEIATLKIGVMTDPTKFETFDEVATVSLHSDGSGFTEFIVPLTGADKTAKYIALVSESDEYNTFFVDNFEVDSIPPCAKAREITVKTYSATQAVFDWNSNGATECDIIVTKTRLDETKEVEDALSALATTDYVHKQGLQKPATVDGLTAETSYFVYIRNKCGSDYGDWSNPQSFSTPARIEDDTYEYDFEIDPNDNTTFTYPESSSTSYKLTRGIKVFSNSFTPHSQMPSSWYGVTPHSGDYVLYARAEDDPTSYTYLVFPEIENLMEKRVTFYSTVRSQDVYSNIIIGVMKDAQDTATFQALDTVTAYADTWSHHIIDMDNYTFDGHFFTFKYMLDASHSSGLAETYVDDMTFCPLPPCKDPQNFTADPSATSVVLTWDDNGAASWDIKLSTESVYDSLESQTYEWEKELTVTEPTAELTGLKANGQKYYYYVRSVCEGNESTPNIWMGAFDFTTECHDKQPLPYTLDIAGGKQVGKQWTFPCVELQYTVKYGSTYYPSKSATTNTMYISVATSSSENDAYIILPEMERPLNELFANIRMKGQYNPAILEVGVLKSLDDFTSFNMIRRLTNEDMSSQDFRVYFSKCETDYKYIALRIPTTENCDTYIEDVTIDLIDGCAEMSDVSATDIQPQQATFGWIGDIEEEWDVVVARQQMEEEELDAAMTDPQANEAVQFAETIHENPYTVTGLDFNTTYFFYVRSKCMPEGGPWTEGVQFRTGCGILSADALGTEDFESYQNGDVSCCWTGFSQNGNVPTISSDNPYSGKNSLNINSGVIEDATADGVFFFSPAIDTAATHSTIDKYQISFWGYAPFSEFTDNACRLDIGVTMDKSDLSTYTAIDSIYNYGVWHHYTIPLDTYLGDYNDVKGQFVTLFSGFAEQNDFYIDDLKIELSPSCLTPRQVSLKDVLPHGATIVWYADQTDVVIRLSNHQLTAEEISLPSIDGVTEIPVSGAKEYTFENLAARTRYYVYVGAECDGMMQLSGPVSFKTVCMEKFALPYSETFDNTLGTGSQYKPDCWTGFHSVAETDSRHDQYPFIDGNGKYGNCLQLYTTNASKISYAFLPKMDVDNLAECQITFFGKGTAVVIGIVPERDAYWEDVVESFIPIDTVMLTDEWKKYYVPLTNYKSSYGEYIGFTMDYYLNRTNGGSGTAYIDELTVDYTPACQAPEEIKFVSVTKESIGFELVEVGEATQWEYACVEHGADTTGMEGTPMSSVQHTVTGLKSVTSYDIYVRSVCDAETKSAWVGPMTQRTLTEEVGSYEEPYLESFENIEENTWTLLGTKGGNSWCTGDAEAYDGTKSLYITSDGTSATYDPAKASRSWAYRTVYLPSGVYYVSYLWQCTGNGYIMAGLLPAEAMFDGGSDKVYYADGSQTTAQSIKPLMKGDRLSGSDEWTNDTVMHVVYVEDEGYYNFVFYWQNDAGESQSDAKAIIDRLEISKVPCVYPMELSVTGLDHESVTLSWTLLDDTEGRQWEIFVTEDPSITDPTGHIAEKLNKGGYADGLTATINGLEEQKTYYAFVRTVCDGGEKYSLWSNRVQFETPCKPVAPNTLYSFEETVPKGWYIGECFSNYGMETFEIVENGPTVQYSHTGDRALHFESYQTGNYLALPKVDGNLDDWQLTFWMRPIYAYAQTVDGEKVYVNNNEYQGGKTASVRVGTMTAVGNPETFIILRECIYPYSTDELYRNRNVNDDMTGNKYWVKFSIPLKGCDGKYIVFSDVQESSTRNNMYIDDIIIEPLNTCATPDGMTVKRYTDKTATISCNHTDGATVEVRYATSYDDMISGKYQTATSEADTVLIEGLAPATEYYYAVRQLCSDDEASDLSIMRTFTTARSVRFNDPFTANVTCPEGWQRATSIMAKDLFAGTAQFGSFTDITNTTVWSHRAIDNYSSAHNVARMHATSSSDASLWFFTPAVYLENGLEAHLSFDMMLTRDESYDAPQLTKRDGYQFMVIVSDDAGQTWKEENATIWNNERANNDFYSIPSTYQEVSIDLSEYAGKTIKVAFYTETQRTALEDLNLHIDNVNINSVVNTVYPEETHCATYDYQLHGFNIPVSDIDEEGLNTFSRTVVSQGTAKDSTFTVQFTVSPVSEKTIEAEMCEGDVYSENGFINVTTAGRHTLKCNGSNHCDSIVHLDLTVKPLARFEFDSTFCEGSPIVWNNIMCDKPGDYTDTIVIGGNRCDSIVVMHLSMVDALYGEEIHYLCTGTSLVIDGEEYLSDGSMQEFVKEETIKEEGRCDSIVTHTVVYTPVHDVVVEDAICDGEIYNANGFIDITQEGTLTTPNRTQFGCDSLVTLNLIVIRDGETSRDVTRRITLDQLPYEFYGETFGTDTKPGTYERDVKVTSVSGSCSMNVHLTLEVEDETGIIPAREIKELALTPNPVRIHETVKVHIDLTPQRLAGLTVQVFNSTGALVQSLSPETEPIVINGLHTAGVYMVRVIDGLGDMYQGKIIVR